MQLETARFGQVEVDEKKILSFKDGLPGLDEYKDYSLLQFEDSYPIFWMQSIEDRNICLPVIDTFQIMPDYAFNIGDDEVLSLGITKPDDVHVMSVMVIPEKLEGMTVNLAAPIVVNLNNGQAKQVILSGGEYNVRYPIFQEICRLIKEDGDAGSLKED